MSTLRESPQTGTTSQETDPLGHLSDTLAHHQTRLVRLYTSIGQADPHSCAAKKISELHVGILHTIEVQAGEVEKEVAEVKHSVNELTEQIKNLRIGLGHLDLEADLQIPHEALVPQLDRIQTIHHHLSQTKFEREILVENLLQRLENFSPILGDKFIQDAITKSNQSLRIGQMFGANLSLEYIARLEQQAEQCQLEVSRQGQVLHEHTQEIFNLWGHLGISPATPSANPAADHSDIDPVVLAHLGFTDVAVTVNGDIQPIGHCKSVKMLPTTSNLEQAKARQLWLDSERQKREELIQTCYDELCVLWTRLGFPEEEQGQFVESWRGLSEQCVEGYQAELNQMIKAKKEHMVVFVQQERDSIIKIWDQMYVAEQERATVEIMYSEDYSEELLASHEKLKAQLMDDLGNKEVLLSLLKKYFELLQEVHELEVAEKDPNRYAKGKRSDPGRLLREEKIRKRVRKEKPKLEDDLKKLIPEWEKERGRPFMVNGSRFLEDLVIRIQKEVALKSDASGRNKSTTPPAQSVKRQQKGTQSQPASPVKGKNKWAKPTVGAMQGSANPFGSATSRLVSKTSSTSSRGAAATRGSSKLAPQPTGSSSVYKTRQRSHTVYKTRQRSHTHLGRPTVTLQYQGTGSSMSNYNPVIPTPMPRCAHPPVVPSLASTSELETTQGAQGEEPTGAHSYSAAGPSSRSVSGQSRCPGIPPGWPTGAASDGTQPAPALAQPARPAPHLDRKYIRLVPAHSLGKGMPAPPLKKGIFRPRPSALPPPLQPIPANILTEPACASRVVSGASSSSSSSCHSPQSFIDLDHPHPSAFDTHTSAELLPVDMV